MRSDMVPVPPNNEKQMLYDLPHIQLGPSDDVCAVYIHTRLFHTDCAAYGVCCVADMGAVCHDVSGALLGNNEYGASLF